MEYGLILLFRADHPNQQIIMEVLQNCVVKLNFDQKQCHFMQLLSNSLEEFMLLYFHKILSPSRFSALLLFLSLFFLAYNVFLLPLLMRSFEQKLALAKNQRLGTEISHRQNSFYESLFEAFFLAVHCYDQSNMIFKFL